jgi:hypothetical protein
MSKITADELSKILKEHKRWCDTDEEEGEKADLRDADLIDIRLCGANLSNADLRVAILAESDLKFTNLVGANLRGANLIEADLSSACLRGACLSDAYLIDVNLSGADLSGAVLSGAVLSGADLSHANLSQANLSQANMSNANLFGADLRGTDLSDADLSCANLIRVMGLTIEQLSSVATLCDTELSFEHIKQVRKKYPHLLKIITLRSSYKTLSVSEAYSMPNVSILKKDDCGFYGHSTINHDYNLKAVGGDKVVVDNATGLVWHQSGSDAWTEWKGAKKWIRSLNYKGYAGYHDWRLPTVDEAVSLLESSKTNEGLYIDPLFSKNQEMIWTGDESFENSEVAWHVHFLNGHVGRFFVWGFYVRPVRSVYDSDEEPEEEVYEEEVLEEEEEAPEEEVLCKPKIITLRSSYEILSTSQVQSMPNVSIREKDKEGGFYGHSTINHDYNLKTIGGDMVVVDNATGLMWHKSGSSNQMRWNKAEKWVWKLNRSGLYGYTGFAGYVDWRLPTVEEVVSLLESNKKNGLYTDPVFYKQQRWIWTGDRNGSEAAWVVNFDNGYVGSVNLSISFRCHIRPVRSVE